VYVFLSVTSIPPTRLTDPGTSEVKPFEFALDGYKIVLIDSPGFNDTVRSETEVLAEIANYLDFTYLNPPYLKLTGILYLQSIMDDRMYHSSLRNLKMFKGLCGESPLKNVVLATNHWQEARLLGKEQQALDKEQELLSDPQFWQPMLTRGSRMVRWEDTTESALEIIRMFVNKTPEVPQIQKELVIEKKKLIETKAGKTVNEKIIELESKYQEEIDKIRKEMDEAKAASDGETQEILEKDRQKYERKLDKLRDDQETLRYERRNEARRMQNEIDDLRAAHKKELEERLCAQKLDFDKTVEQLSANQDKFREEQRLAMEAEIEAMNSKPKESRSAAKLLVGLVPLLGSAVLGFLGIPIAFVGDGGAGGGGS
jgi:hypothetical protein